MERVSHQFSVIKATIGSGFFRKKLLMYVMQWLLLWDLHRFLFLLMNIQVIVSKKNFL